MIKFSVLMSIYYKEKAEYFNRAMKSIWDEQSIKPNEIILVQDGVLTVELYEVIEIWRERLRDILKIIPLDKNLGLGDALNEGIAHCSNELIARMDTDDISLPNRFEKQLDIFKNPDIDVCSSWIGEFDDDENKIISYRKVPEKHFEIIKYSKMRNPINHPAVMFKKKKVLEAGNYKKMISFEDYYLWIRMIMNNSKLYNIQETLVLMRAGYYQLERRRGLGYVNSECNFWSELYKIGFINFWEYIKNLSLKLIIRVLPRKIINKIYQVIRDN